MCADRIHHRNYILWEEAMLPTISLEALFVSLLTDTHELRAAHMFDVTGAYIHA